MAESTQDRQGKDSIMAQHHTAVGSAGVGAFLDAVTPPARAAEARQLAALFAEVTGYPPRVWGSILGFGRYAYRYESGHSGESPAIGFAPRKAEIVLYLPPRFSAAAPLLADLGPHRLGKSCLYLRRLDGVDMQVLRRLIRAGLEDLARCWTVLPE
ncbi:hypothetical protein MASR2M74_11110 [Paracoccaceae bacterium]